MLAIILSEFNKINNLRSLISASLKSCDVGDEIDVKLLLLLDAFKTSEIDVEISTIKKIKAIRISTTLMKYNTLDDSSAVPVSSETSVGFIKSIDDDESSCKLL